MSYPLGLALCARCEHSCVIVSMGSLCDSILLASGGNNPDAKLVALVTDVFMFSTERLEGKEIPIQPSEVAAEDDNAGDDAVGEGAAGGSADEFGGFRGGLDGGLEVSTG